MKWLISGVSSGLGKAIAEAALSRGDTVAGFVRTPEAASTFMETSPRRAHAFIADVSDREAVFSATFKAIKVLDGLDIVVNSAGQVLESYVEEAQPAAIRTLFEVNFLGPLNVIQAVLPYFRNKGRGRIANISSGGGIQGVPSLGIYCASKFALEGMSEALSAEVSGLGIHITIVEPGAFRTNLLVKSKTTIESSIADYEKSAGEFRRFIKGLGGNEPGDPAKLAKAMLVWADSAQPPLRLALGDDAIQMAQSKADSILSDLNAWRSVGTGLALGETPV